MAVSQKLTKEKNVSAKGTTPQVYALAGKRGSGKSTAAEALAENGFVDVKFADPLKNMMRAFYRTCDLDTSTIERKLEGDLKEVACEWLQGKTPRYAMQTLGTEWRDMIGTKLWADIFVSRIKDMGPNAKVVCSDYRFPGHETEALDAVGATKIKIVRPKPSDNDEYSKHASEANIDTLPVDMVVNNTGTIADLQEWILGLIEAREILRDHGVLDAIASRASA